MGGPASYGDEFVDVYDQWYGDDRETEVAVRRIVELAAGGRVLELGAGTGRLAIPLAARGLPVVAVDASTAMLDRLSHKPGGDQVDVVAADMTALGAGDDDRLDGPFTVAVIARNTIFNVTDPDAARRGIAGVAARLDAHGALVIEADIPDPAAPATGREVRRRPGGEEVMIAWEHHAEHQTVSGRMLDGRGRVRRWAIRYAPPEEIDQWAGASGLRLERRWADWHGRPAGPTSSRHVSVYRARVPASASDATESVAVVTPTGR